MRLPSLQPVYLTLLLAGTALALGANALEMSALSNAGILVVFVAMAIYGLDMIVQRRAEVAAPGSEDVDPSFHVFRGAGAVAWGVAFVTFGVGIAASIYVAMAGWSQAGSFLAAHDGIFVIGAGVLLTSWGIGGASRATFRRGDTQAPARRLGVRLVAGGVIVPAGVLMLAWGVVMTLMPSLEDKISTGVRDAASRLIEWIML
ncbi:MAG TPA: hypothetical protein VFO19_02295 [Vicinamibacterales bacterium]|nr:hypothetical protein [Vicinamibacterales bacterium]